uniref:Uncharacterized protein n=1 Tax=Anopheles farauti TaxID=69004 RepID=A0A182QTL3_9DIPT
MAAVDDDDVLRTKLDRIFDTRPSADTSAKPTVSYSIEIAAKDDFDIARLQNLTPQPIFCSLPWISDDNLRYADDFPRSPTLQLAGRLREAQYTVVTHVSCYNITEQQVDRLFDSTDIRNAFVIRGDTVNPAQRFQNSADLVEYLRKREHPHRLTLGVGGYPYGHHQSPSVADELRYLRAKIDRGVDYLLTQTLYDAGSYFRYRDRCRRAGISVPIVPGIYVPHSYRHLQAMLALTRIQLPPTVRDAFEAHANDAPEQFEAFAIEYFVGVVRELLEPNDAAGLNEPPVRLVHFFTFNKLGVLEKVLQQLGEFFQ